MASTDPALPTIDLGLPGWRLRAWRTDDAPSLAQHADDFEIWRWMSDGFPRPYTLDVARHWCARGHIEFGGENWAIAFDDIAVGGCGLRQQAGEFRCVAEIGWWLGRMHWGRGVVSRTARALIARAFDHPQIERVVAPIHDGNERSVCVAHAAGMQLEALQHRSALKAGRVIDRRLYVRLRDA